MLANETPEQGSVGKAFPGLDVRLSEGNEGEVLVKSPNLFTEYDRVHVLFQSADILQLYS